LLDRFASTDSVDIHRCTSRNCRNISRVQMHILSYNLHIICMFFFFLGKPKPFNSSLHSSHPSQPFFLCNPSLLFLSSSFLIWSLPTPEPLPEVLTSEWRHQVVPTVVRPNVRRPIAPSPVDAPTSPFIHPSPSSMIPDPHIHTQTSTVAPVIASISVPSSDSLTGICWSEPLSVFHSHSVCVHIVFVCFTLINRFKHGLS